MDPLNRIVSDLAHRVVGPLHFRLLLQPAMATFFGVRDGLKDAREHRPAYFWSLLTNPSQARVGLEAGLKAVTRVLVFALVMDAVYQLIALHWFYPGEAILVALILAFVPYLVIRGPANRIARWLASRRVAGQAGHRAS